MTEKIKINALYLGEFRSKQDWINRARSVFPKLPLEEKTLCVDRNGDILTIGEDFRAATERDTYPIKVYLLKRTSHQNQR